MDADESKTEERVKRRAMMINISTLNSQTQRSIERERGMEESFVATIFQVLLQQYFVHKLFLVWGNIVHFIHRSYQKALRYLGEEDRHRSWTINYIYDDGQRFHKACTPKGLGGKFGRGSKYFQILGSRKIEAASSCA